MTRASDDNTPPDAPHAPGTDTDPHRGEASEARPDLLRRLLDTLGWESGTDEQALEALAGAVRAARGDRTHKDVYQQRNEARAECERLRRELSEAREAVGEGWLDEDRTLAEAIRRKVAALETHLRGLTRELMTRRKVSEQHPPAPVDGPRSEHQHTGATAFWCGICGDCVCPRDSNGECHFDNEKCPLHRAGSAHVEGPEGGAR